VSDVDQLDDEFDDDDADDDVDGNRLVGGTARSVAEYVAKALVEDPDAVEVEVEERRSGGLSVRMHVAPGDMGRVIGKRGRVAHAIRTVVRAAAARDGVSDADVDFVE
jgi:predicted RNA-binding protein YlqC (UPF0109 family)